MSSRRGRVLVAISVAAAGFGIATVVQAAVPSADGIIHGCYGNASQPAGVRGDLRVRINAPAEQCPPGFTPVDWNQTGPTGPTGSTGPTGHKGPTGPTGPRGPSDAWYGQSAANTNIPSTGLIAVTVASVTLPAGNFAVTASGWAADSAPVDGEQQAEGNSDVRCSIRGFVDTVEDAFLNVGPFRTLSDEQSYSTTLNFAVPGGGATINLQCINSGTNVILGGRISATQVATLHGVTPLAPVKNAVPGAKANPQS